jgi:predicted membrane protein
LAVALTGILATLPYIALQLIGLEVVIAAMGVQLAGAFVYLPLIISFAILAAFDYFSGLRAPAAIAIIKDIMIYITVFAAVIVIPVLISEYEFQDSLQNIARFASVNRKTNEQIKQAVMEEAQKEDLPVQAEDIKVEGNAGNVHINVDYSVTVDLKVYQWTLNFHPAATNMSIL